LTLKINTKNKVMIYIQKFKRDNAKKIRIFKILVDDVLFSFGGKLDLSLSGCRDNSICGHSESLVFEVEG
jgi:hypothetical protein